MTGDNPKTKLKRDGATPLPGTELEREIERLSLSQALADFEVANLRVRDLTQRLVEAAAENKALEASLREQTEAIEDMTRLNTELQTENSRLTSSKAYKLANFIWAIRRTFHA